MTLLPPLIYGVGNVQPPQMITLVIWRQTLGTPVPTVMHFPIMPESYMVLYKYLTTITPTKDGGFVDDYGPAPSPISLKGTFGRNTKGFFNGNEYNGFGWVQYLKWFVDISHEVDSDGNMPSVWLMSHISQDFYEVELMSFSKSQSIGRNMLWVYELKLMTLKAIEGVSIVDDVLTDLGTIVRDLGAKAIKDVSKVVV